MFSGIVEEYATVVALVKDQENIHFTLKCSFVNELKIDQSISHNGVCLTVVSMTEDTYTVTAMKDTGPVEPSSAESGGQGERGTQHDDERTSGRPYCAGTCGSDRRMYRYQRCRRKLVFYV